MTSRYWDRVRLTRRRWLGASGAGLAGAAALAAVGCGDDDEDAPGGGTTGGGGGTAATQPAGGSTPSGEKPKRGGTIAPGQRLYNFALPGLDPHVGAYSNLGPRGNAVYSRLVNQKPGAGFLPEHVGDLAKSWEHPDDLTWVVKLNTAAKFHPPLNRPLTAEDVVFSFNRLQGAGGFKASPSRQANVDSWTAVDGETVRIKTTAPDPYFEVQFLAAYQSVILPKEAGTAFDPAQKMVGTGPWIFDSYQTGSKISYVRNPQWHQGPDRPYFERLEVNILQDQTAKLNFFLGGSLDFIDARGVDMATIAGAVKNVQVVIFPDATGWGYQWQFRDTAPNAPWKDERVRRAMSMALDREEVFEAANQASLARKAGFKVDTLFMSHVGSHPSFRVDPRTELDAEGADNFKFNPQKAKALLAEAGYPNGFSIDIERLTGIFGDPYDNVAEKVPGMWNAVGIKTNIVVRDYVSHFSTKNQTGVFDQSQFFLQGNFYRNFALDAKQALTNLPSNGSHFEDPELVRMIDAIYGKDPAQVKAAIKPIANHLAKRMWWIPLYARMNYYANQPNLKGATEYYTIFSDYGDPEKNVPHYWRA